MTSLKKYSLILVVAWTVIVVLGAAVHLRQVHRDMLELVRIQAVDSFDKDLVHRRWAAGYGGVYVPVTEETPPNPHLAHVEGRDLVTTSGLELTLVNPAYITRMVHELGQEQYGHRGHITSLNPLRPENSPDLWEAGALRAFEDGETEVVEVAKIGGEEYMRLMRPMMTKERCLKCHAHQGYKVGEIRGGISVSVPMAPIWSIMKVQLGAVTMAYGFVWLLGLGGIGLGASRIRWHIHRRDRTEEALHEKEEFQQSIFRVAPIGIGVVVDRVMQRVNNRMCEMTGYSEEELTGQNARIVYPTDEDFEFVGREKYHQIQEHGTGSVETRFKRKDGRIIDVFLSSIPLDPDDLSKGVTFTALDITERKEAGQALEDKERYYRTMLHSLQEDLMVIDRDYRIVDVNNSLLISTGHKREEILGRTCYDVMHRSDVPCHELEGHECRLQDVFESGEAFNCRHLHVAADGSPVHVDILLSPMKDAEGNVTHVVEAGRDISGIVAGQVEREWLLQETGVRAKELRCMFSVAESIRTRETLEQVFEDVVQLIPGGWLYPKIARVRLRVNEHEFVSEPFEDTQWKQSAAITVYGEALGSIEVFHLEKRPQMDEGQFLNEERALLHGIAQALGAAIEHYQAEEELGEHRRNLEDLVQERTTQLNARVAEAEELNSAMVNVMGDLRTMNLELETVSRELKASNQELDSFSYSVSHDLRAPVRHIAGFVDLLKESSTDQLSSAGRRHLDIIAESATRMGHLIDDLLAFSRAGRVDLRKAGVGLQEFVKEVVEEVGAQAKDRDISWEIEALPEVHADRATLRQVLVNLLGNAVKYTRDRENAHIKIGTTSGEGGETVVFVRDNGVGFDMKYVDKLFGVFQRLHSTEEFEGTGVGLANVRRIIHRHGGKTWAEGKVGEGATFFFSLPRKEG